MIFVFNNLTHHPLVLLCIDLEMKLGLDEPVYCVYDYKAESEDELTLHINDQLTVLRRGDKYEQDWWWARNNSDNSEGYVAKNLLAVSIV